MKEDFSIERAIYEVAELESFIEYLTEEELKEFIVDTVKGIKKQHGYVPGIFLKLDEIREAIEKEELDIDKVNN
jgi:hypothetical protein